jgi:ABC-type microcin C transport system permease subunit YejB
MAKYIAQRLIVMFFILLGVLTITFVLSRALPGSPVEMMLGNHPTVEQIAVARENLGLDKPLPIQYFNYIGDLLRGDFGTSLRTGRPVVEEVVRRVGATFELTFLAMFSVSSQRRGRTLWSTMWHERGLSPGRHFQFSSWPWACSWCSTASSTGCPCKDVSMLPFFSIALLSV